ncbi:MAG: hypothetical protein N2117_04790 [Anaerolineales bacterium]|nr:hypothetical protein [Anaerolineales bacterium]MDW8279364.1 hypothetical protein [Anaerolineales bacterium]
MTSIGPIALLGSGETSLVGGRIFEHLARQIDEPLRVAILETPAGFELNSAQVAGRIANFLQSRLANYKPEIHTIPARKRGTAFTPEDPEVCAPLLNANLIFMGPGSPTYAIRQLQDSLAWHLVRARHRMGAALVFASAATIAIGQVGLPVYEIYKAGQDVYTVPGLGLFNDFGVPLSFIPHWNNTDGGQDLDTSRCFMGQERFQEWYAQLPDGHTVIGLDEHTGFVFDFRRGEGQVIGISSVTLMRTFEPVIYPSGSVIRLDKIGDFQMPTPLSAGIPPVIWEMAQSTSRLQVDTKETASAEILALVEARQAARARKDWTAADEYRRRIQSLGWMVQDTPDGPRLVKA